jgi:hypothetical protein
LFGLRGPAATLVHLIAMLGAEEAVLPALGMAEPTSDHGIKAIGTHALHHAVYAGVSGLVRLSINIAEGLALRWIRIAT